ncbi:MAG TPA: ABC transporter substrate-binding protein [Acidimicrobiales bacterium]
MRRAMTHTPRRSWALSVLLASALVLSACGGGGGDDTVAPPAPGAPPKGENVHVTIGYQSKTINTVTAGTLMRDLGIFERRLAEVGQTNGNTYSVTWEDYPSGPPITAQMLAGKVDIGSMGDYPLLVNGSKTKEEPDARSELLAITGYNLRGSLNGVVVPLDSEARSLADLEGESVSTSVGSAAHGMIVQALSDMGHPPEFVQLTNQQPEVGASALEGGQVSALAQFVPWPDLLVFRGKARKLFDGGDNGVPTMHGVIGRKAYSDAHPEVVEAFLAGVVEATEYIHTKPMDAAERVSKATGIEVEVVYLFNGPNGVVSFDPTIKPKLVDALRNDLPFLKSLSALTDLDIDQFVNDSYLRRAYGPAYADDQASYVNPSALTGQDTTCNRAVSDPMTASEAWFEGQATTRVAATPTCLISMVRAAQSSGSVLKVAYVPDATTGTRLFARTATWVDDPAAPTQSRMLPFSTLGAAEGYAAAHPGARVSDFDGALQALAGI